MNNVNKTLYIPLYGKAYVSKRGFFLSDQKAEAIWEAEGFPLKGKSKSKWLAFYMGIRSAVFDDWLNVQMQNSEDFVVLHIGCGMDSRIERVDRKNHKWYDIDLPEVITERKKYFKESETYHMIGIDIRQPDWLSYIPEKKQALIVMEGVSMYLSSKELQEVTNNLCAQFQHLTILMDCYTELAAKMSKYKNPIHDVGVTCVYGMDHPETLEHSDLVFVKEHEMTPDSYIQELHGTEKAIFQKLYAGNFSKKLYRLYEYYK